MTTYGTLDVAFFAKYANNPTVEAMAIALAMPSVERSGTRSQRQGLKAAGLGSYYHARTMAWAGGDVNAGLTLLQFAIDTAQQQPSSKANHLEGLSRCDGGLIRQFKRNGMLFTALTDAGVAQCKAVNTDLGKAAKAYTVEAYEKALKAAEKASKPAKPPKAPKRPKVTPAAQQANAAGKAIRALPVEVEAAPVAPQAAADATTEVTG